MSYHHCPHCGHHTSWPLRRQARKCKKCRAEWTPDRWLVDGIRISRRDWRIFLRCFLRYKTIRGIRLHFPHAHTQILKMCHVTRMVMSHDLPTNFAGTVEVDETYIAGTWYNKRWSVRQQGTKRGRGTTKQPIFGIFERPRKVVRAWMIPDVRKTTIMPIIRTHVVVGSIIYSDGYELYQKTPAFGYHHDYVEHDQNEYARGDVHTNSMEGFWGLLKRRLRSTGGVRRERLVWYVNEEVWRYNHSTFTEVAQIQKLLQLLKQFGGKKTT